MAVHTKQKMTLGFLFLCLAFVACLFYFSCWFFIWIFNLLSDMQYHYVLFAVVGYDFLAFLVVVFSRRMKRGWKILLFLSGVSISIAATVSLLAIGMAIKY